MTDPGAVARAEVIVARDRATETGVAYLDACAALDRAKRALETMTPPLAIPPVPKPVAVPSRPDLPLSTLNAMNEAHDEIWRVCYATDNPWATMLDARDAAGRAARRRLRAKEAAK